MPGQDLIDAVVEALESDINVTGAFGDTWNQQLQTGVSKFFADISDQVPLPYCVIMEIGETYEYMTRASQDQVWFTSPGTMTFDIYASDRLETRQLGFVIGKSLNDNPLAWPVGGGETMVFRMSKSQFLGMQQIGPQAPITFRRLFTFDYMYQGAL